MDEQEFMKLVMYHKEKQKDAEDEVYLLKKENIMLRKENDFLRIQNESLESILQHYRGYL